MTLCCEAIHWFRQDLRLSDNLALSEAARAGFVLPIYILDENLAGEFKVGGASRWWLHQSLSALNQSLGGTLSVYVGSADVILPELVKRFSSKKVTWNRCYEPWRQKQDAAIAEQLEALGVTVFQGQGALLREPWEVLKDDGTFYKVFTPFYKKGYGSSFVPVEPVQAPSGLKTIRDDQSLEKIEMLGLLPKVRWDHKFEPHWTVGESGAKQRLEAFLENGLFEYAEGRNFPARPWISKLSPHLHFGEISPRQIVAALYLRSHSNELAQASEAFYRELVWREFSAYLLHFFPKLPTQNFQPKFDAFPWNENLELLKKWQRGETGVPIVDAGMKELWETGFMHNRVRMIAASFLVKHLRIHWRHGAAWFWDCLVDADLASNSASWQWVAGSGADASPYFRIFNPITQAEKFDPQGVYVRKYNAELSVKKPIVELSSAREESLSAYFSLSKS